MDVSTNQYARFDLWLRSGLVKEKDLPKTRIAFKDVDKNVRVEWLRRHILNVYKKLLDITIEDQDLYQRIRNTILQKYGNGKTMAEELSEGKRGAKPLDAKFKSHVKKLVDSNDVHGLSKLHAQTKGHGQAYLIGKLNYLQRRQNSKPQSSGTSQGKMTDPEKHQAAIHRLINKKRKETAASTFTARKPPAPRGSDEYNKFHGITTPEKKPEKKGFLSRLRSRWGSTNEETELSELTQSGIEKYLRRAQQDRKNPEKRKKGMHQAYNKLDAAAGEGSAKVPASKFKKRGFFWEQKWDVNDPSSLYPHERERLEKAAKIGMKRRAANGKAAPKTRKATASKTRKSKKSGGFRYTKNPVRGYVKKKLRRRGLLGKVISSMIREVRELNELGELGAQSLRKAESSGRDLKTRQLAIRRKEIADSQRKQNQTNAARRSNFTALTNIKNKKADI